MGASRSQLMSNTPPSNPCTNLHCGNGTMVGQGQTQFAAFLPADYCPQPNEASVQDCYAPVRALPRSPVPCSSEGRCSAEHNRAPAVWMQRRLHTNDGFNWMLATSRSNLLKINPGGTTLCRAAPACRRLRQCGRGRMIRVRRVLTAPPRIDLRMKQRTRRAAMLSTSAPTSSEWSSVLYLGVD
jgi:hypothetical protein